MIARKDQIAHCRLQVASLDNIIDQLQDARDDMEEQHRDLIAGRCAQCDVLLFHGDKGHTCIEGDPIFCAEHAYTFEEVAQQRLNGPEEYQPEEHLEFHRLLLAHLRKGGSIKDKVLHEL